MRDVDALMPIGRFARICRLSVKALRHYDDLGLLRPTRVDAGSGYRYYHRTQARTAIAIALLRSLGLPLPRIRELLATDDPEVLTRLLAAERERLEREVKRAREALLSLERIIREGSVLPYEPAMRTEPARTVLVVEETTAAERHVEATFALVARLEERLRALDLPLASPVMCLLPDPPDDDSVTLRVCCPVPTELARTTHEVITLPAGPAAVVTHRGPYEELGLAQHALLAWVQERGLEASGPVREVYVDDPATVPAGEVRTEVVMPLIPSADTRRSERARP